MQTCSHEVPHTLGIDPNFICHKLSIQDKLHSPIQENKQIRETKQIYKPMVKKKESSKWTYDGTKKTMKGRRRWEEAREQKYKRKRSTREPFANARNKQINETKKIYKPLEIELIETNLQWYENIMKPA